MSKFTKAYINGNGCGNRLANCQNCGKATHSEMTQVYSAVFAGTDSVYCKPCLKEIEREEIAECPWLSE